MLQLGQELQRNVIIGFGDFSHFHVDFGLKLWGIELQWRLHPWVAFLKKNYTSQKSYYYRGPSFFFSFFFSSFLPTLLFWVFQVGAQAIVTMKNATTPPPKSVKNYKFLDFVVHWLCIRRKVGRAHLPTPSRWQVRR